MELIKKLREMTGAGMLDCQKALVEANNDLNLAVEILRKKGIAKAAKRSGREAKEGLVKAAVNDSQTEAYILELDSETDFVARNEKFTSLANDILELIKNKKPQNLNALLAADLKGFSVQDAIANLSGTIGENLVLKRFAIISGKTASAYIHPGGRLGVLLTLDQEGKNAIAKDLAMQVAAVNPKYILPSDVDSQELAKEKDIYKEELLKAGKPEALLDKILNGKINKYYSQVCLVEQEYIKDDKKKVKEILGDINILKFVRFSL